MLLLPDGNRSVMTLRGFIVAVCFLFFQCSEQGEIEDNLNEYFEKKTDGLLTFELDDNGLVTVYSKVNRLCTDKYIFDVREVKKLDRVLALKTDAKLRRKFQSSSPEAQRDFLRSRYTIAPLNRNNTINYIDCVGDAINNSPQQVINIPLPISDKDFNLIWLYLEKYKQSLQ